MPDFKKYNLMHSTNYTHTINYNILEMKNVSYHIRKKKGSLPQTIKKLIKIKNITGTKANYNETV